MLVVPTLAFPTSGVLMAARPQSLPGSSHGNQLLTMLCAVACPGFADALVTNIALPHIRAACPPGRPKVTFAADAVGSPTAPGDLIPLRRMEHDGITVATTATVIAGLANDYPPTRAGHCDHDLSVRDQPEGAVMLTLPVQAGRAAADRPARILVIGRSETVLSELVTILRDKGYAAGATNEFGRTLDLFDAGQLDLVVFGGMVPPDTRERLREQISARNPAVAFVQGYAGIPGLIAAQVQAALGDGTPGPATTVMYDARSRSIGISLDRPQHVTVIAWWHTSFTPPEPQSTSRVILDEELPAGPHTIAIPDEVPAQASFATVSTGPSVHAFIVGPMPSGTTTARLPNPSSP
jgi:hypothetical protein